MRAAGAGDAAGAHEATHRLARLLEPHTSREELGLFAALREEPELADHVDVLCLEHAEIDALVERVASGDLGSAPTLEHLLRRHIDKEENGLFPAAVIALDGPTWDRVAAAGS